MDNEEYRSVLEEYKNGCVFCEPNPDLVLTKNDWFTVTFDAAPLMPGHIILHSNDHYSCAGDVPSEHFQELLRLKGEVKNRMQDVFGSVTMYEHGRAGHCLSDGPDHRLCHHFHLHMVPGDIDISAELLERFRCVPLERYEEITDIYGMYGNYLYLESDGGVMSFFDVNTEIERHLLRTMVAVRNGVPERADWRSFGDKTLLEEGFELLKPVWEAEVGV